jgi:hypothetical protein
MEYNQVQINKADNGFIVATTKHIFGQQHPDQAVNVFKQWDEVELHLNPKKAKLSVAS